MNHNFLKRIIYSIFLIVAVVLFGCGGDTDTVKKAPDFTLKDLLGNIVSLQQYRGKVVLLDFWATWCRPCHYSIPELVELQKKYMDQGLVILGVSVDNPFQIKNRDLSAFKEKYGINYKILRADGKTTTEYLGNGDFYIPTMFVVDRDGVIVNKHEGFIPGQVEKSLKKIL